LDFNHLVAEKESDPTEWPEPFTASENIHPMMLDMGGGHFVRVQEGTEQSELIS